MKELTDDTIQYVRLLEESIATLPVEEQGKLYRACAKDCVTKYVLAEQKRLFEACHYDMDEMYSMPDTEFFFGRIIEPGHIYEMGYPRCLCYMVDAGISNAPVHCECSRQSILYVLHELLPERCIQVETIETVLAGADKCRFRITIE